MRDTSAGHAHGAGWCEIRLKGHLSARWAARFDGMTLTSRADGTTLIEGPVVDRAALHGLLRTLRDLGLPLLSVTRPTTPQSRKETDTASTIPTRPTGPKGVPMDSTRRTARVTGALFIITFLTSIPAALMLHTPVLEDANYIVGAGADDAGVALGAFLEVLLIVANVGTAVALFPILKRQSEPLALGYVAARLVECTFIAIGIISLLAVMTLRQDFTAAAGGDPGSFVTAALLGVIEPDSALKNLAAAPEFVWELSLGIYLLVKGFKPSGIERLQADPPGGPDTAGGPNSLALSPPGVIAPHRRDP